MIEDLIRIYSKSKPIGDVLPTEDLNYQIFMKKKGLPVALAETRKVVSLLRPYKSLYRFFEEGKNPYFWMIPVATLSKKIIGFIIRSFYDKYYMTLFEKDSISPMFGWEDFSNFKVGEPIVLCEGVKDAIFVKQDYPYVFSLNTSEITSVNLEILKKLTNKIIICYDNDDTGVSSSKKDYSLWCGDSYNKCKILLPKIKNGDCADYFKSENKTDSEIFLSEIEVSIKELKGGL